MFSTLTRWGVVGSLVFFKPNRLDGDEVFTFYFCLVLIFLSLFVRKVREADVKLPGLFVLSLGISLCINFSWPSRMVTLNSLIGLLAIKAVLERYDFDVYKTARALFVFCAFNCAFLLLQKVNMDPIFMKVYEEKAGMMWMPWMLGASAVMCIPFLTQVSKKYALIALPMLLESRSKSCMVAAVIAFYLSSGGRLNFKWIGFSIIAILSYVYFADFNFDLTRAHVWGKALAYMKNPWIGNGPGSWAQSGFLKYNGATPEHWRWAHNEWVQVLYEQGGLGVVALSGLVLGLLRRDRLRLAMLGTLVMMSFFHPVFRFGKFLGLIVLIFAWIMHRSERGSRVLEFQNTI